MKKTYINPSLKVVEIKTASILAGSTPQLRGTTESTSGNLSRRGRFSDWDEEEE